MYRTGLKLTLISRVKLASYPETQKFSGRNIKLNLKLISIAHKDSIFPYNIVLSKSNKTINPNEIA